MVTGTVISSTVFNALTADLATGLSTCVLKDGTQTITANIPLGTYKLTGVGAATARTDAATLANIQDNTGVYVGTVGGTADVITLTPSPAIASYASGQTFRFISSGANTTTVTVNISALGAKAITKNGATALAANDIPSGMMVSITYDGTQFVLAAVAAVPVSAFTAAGDIVEATGASVVARMPATASVAAHATTSDIWVAREIVLTGGAVTFTDIADADYAGQVVWVKQNAAHTWTNGAVFAIQGGANWTAAANDWIRVYATTVSTFEITIFPVASYNRIAQVVKTQTGAVATGTTVLPSDDSIPQKTEGDQYMTLSITPKNASSTLIIEVSAQLSTNTSGSAAGILTGALFQDATADALAAGSFYADNAGTSARVTFSHTMTAGTVSSTTFAFRAGPGGAATVTFNGVSSGRLFGGVVSSSIIITEVLP